MPVNDDLGKRMKEYYEQISKTKLMRRCPVVLRIDGRAFHTFCRPFDKPFDNILIKTMQDTMKYLCENIGGYLQELPSLVQVMTYIHHFHLHSSQEK